MQVLEQSGTAFEGFDVAGLQVHCKVLTSSILLYTRLVFLFYLCFFFEVLCTAWIEVHCYHAAKLSRLHM